MHKLNYMLPAGADTAKRPRNTSVQEVIPFKEYDIEKDMAAARRKDKLSPQKGVPFAVVNGRKIYGYSPEGYESALKNR